LKRVNILILSVSRRTDIPAFYLDWFINRIKEGYVYVRNPMNYNMVSKINLSPEVIDCIVFWTKDPTNFLRKIDEFKDYNYYFQITITPYGKDIERNLGDKKEIINSFIELSDRIGKEKVIWRYDPIIITDNMDIEYHKEEFKKLAEMLSDYTDVCVISFLDIYSKTQRNMKAINPTIITEEQMYAIAEELNKIAKEHSLTLKTCSERIDLTSLGIEHSKCIDDELISTILGEKLDIKKDKNQREECGCVESIDIGVYNTCRHGCLYCYANFSQVAVNNSIKKYDVNSPFLCGKEEKDDKVIERKMKSYRRKSVQIFMFDGIDIGEK